MVLTQRRKLILFGSLLVLSLYGLTLIPRMGKRSALNEAKSFEVQKDAELPMGRNSGGASLELQQAPRVKSFLSRAAPPPSAQNTPAPSASQPAPIRMAVPPAPADRLEIGQKVVRSAQLSLEVKAYGPAFDRVEAVAAEVGGYISAILVSRPEENRAQGTITLRVPPAAYYLTLDKLRPLGVLESESGSLQDVTRRWLNLDARIKHKREIEARMWGSVRNTSGSLQWLSEAEGDLDGFNESIERLESERYDLQQEVLLSTITLDLHEPAMVPPAPGRPSLWVPLGEALKEASAQVVRDVSRLIYLGIVLVPWALLGWMLWRPAVRCVRRLRELQRERRLDTV